ncbi:RNA transcription, translation and transport factor protein [Toxorhynchites rutilus septentrionalis]|uniref:RNA transcription, translation and transport factor protein n=1 Tax=Toxorhynchites rutilus septentrionalis TaxID=329112 RepID=UPI00247A0058|nr:RNA transcription, translation and transport factor protein [Toxorhynchites rutilus septentrionalis]
MFERYLAALEYPAQGGINIDDPKEFRNIVLWLEDQKIRYYTIEDRANLRKVGSAADWDPAYEKFKLDLKFPTNLKSKVEELTWLFLYAIKLEYSDNSDRYRSITAAKKLEEKKATAAPEIKSTNPFDNLDFTSSDFEEGSRKLAEKLGVAYHPDYLMSLRSAARVISTTFNKEALKEPIITGKPFPIDEGIGMGFGKDPDLEKAARILRLLQIQSLRKLQTTINETIVAVQNITADPRTDTTLGKVGR